MKYLDRVEQVTESGCWIWMGTTTGRTGYGQLGLNGVRVLAHRYFFEEAKGPIPDGLEIDHLCRVRLCVNPDHLEAVTHAENERRRVLAKKNCKNGHPLEGPLANVRLEGRSRVCRTCMAANMARYKAIPENRDAMRAYWRERDARRHA